MTHPARAFVLHEATYRQVQDLRPNVAVLPWAATEAHNYHLPHGTDTIEGTALGEVAVGLANQGGARCILLPTVPFGNDNMQLDQAATITMRSSTQAAVLHDIAFSLVQQGIDRLVVLNFHGANDFRSMIRDVMLDLPIFIVQVNGYALAPFQHLLEDRTNILHADEFETSLLLHLTPEWVAPLKVAGDGKVTPSTMPALANPAVFYPRHWASLTADTGAGNPRAATAEKGRQIFELLTNALVPILTELSAAKLGEFPFVIAPSRSSDVPRDQDPTVTRQPATSAVT